jgi:hypothetical protein
MFCSALDRSTSPDWRVFYVVGTAVCLGGSGRYVIVQCGLACGFEVFGTAGKPLQAKPPFCIRAGSSQPVPCSPAVGLE